MHADEQYDQTYLATPPRAGSDMIGELTRELLLLTARDTDLDIECSSSVHLGRSVLPVLIGANAALARKEPSVRVTTHSAIPRPLQSEGA